MASGQGSPIKAVLYAFVANLGIALAKTGAALPTGSGSMIAEAVHSHADAGNQLLLLLGMYRAGRPAGAEHPLGQGKVSYFMSFVVAELLFSLGRSSPSTKAGTSCSSRNRWTTPGWPCWCRVRPWCWSRSACTAACVR